MRTLNFPGMKRYYPLSPSAAFVRTTPESWEMFG